MNNIGYVEFDGTERALILTKLQESYELGKLMWEDPLKIKYVSGGVIYGLEVPLAAVRALSNTFGQKDLYFLYQDLMDSDVCDISMLSEQWKGNNYPANICYLWTIENLIIFDSSHKWFIQFNAEISMGVLVFRYDIHENLISNAIRAYSEYGSLLKISDVLNNIQEDLSNYGNSVQLGEQLKKYY